MTHQGCEWFLLLGLINQLQVFKPRPAFRFDSSAIQPSVVQLRVYIFPALPFESLARIGSAGWSGLQGRNTSSISDHVRAEAELRDPIAAALRRALVGNRTRHCHMVLFESQGEHSVVVSYGNARIRAIVRRQRYFYVGITENPARRQAVNGMVTSGSFTSDSLVLLFISSLFDVSRLSFVQRSRWPAREAAC